MRIRSVALLLGALLLAAAPAQAQTERSYAAYAIATSAQVLIGGQGLQLGHASVGIRSDASNELPNCEAGTVACAHAATVVGGNDAKASSPGEAEAVGEPNGELPPELAPLLVAHFGKAVAKAVPGNASGETDLTHIELTATQSFAENATPLTDGLKQLSEELFGPMAEGDPSGEIGPRLKQSFDSLVENLDQNPLVELDVLASKTQVSDNGTLATATAATAGAVIVISPTAVSEALAPEGLIIVEVGAARASASSDGTTDGDAAAARIRIFNPVTGAYDEIPVAAGDYQCGGDGTPLATCVGVGAVAAEAGVVRAGGVSVNALDGQLKIELGAVEAGGVQETAPVPGPVPAPLPHTGGGAAVPALALLGMAGGVTAMIRRRG